MRTLDEIYGLFSDTIEARSEPPPPMTPDEARAAHDELLVMRTELRDAYEEQRGRMDEAYTEAIQLIDWQMSQLKSGAPIFEPVAPLPEPEPVP